MKNTPMSIRYFYFLIFMVPTVLFFQNCGQNGSIELQNAQESTKLGQNDITTPPEDDGGSEGLIIDPDADPSVAKNSCGKIVISDFWLAVSSINSGLSVVDADPSISMNKLTLKVKALTNDRVKNINLKLASAGNKVMSKDGKEFLLKTPSAQTSGLKVHLSNDFNLQVDAVYSLVLEVNIGDQIVSNPQKCIFKPVIKSAQLVQD